MVLLAEGRDQGGGDRSRVDDGSGEGVSSHTADDVARIAVDGGLASKRCDRIRELATSLGAELQVQVGRESCRIGDPAQRCRAPRTS